MYSSTARRHIFGQVVRTVTKASLRASRQATTLASTVRSLFGARDLESPAFHVVDQLEHYEVRHYWQELVKAEASNTERLAFAPFSVSSSFSLLLLSLIGQPPQPADAFSSSPQRAVHCHRLRRPISKDETSSIAVGLVCWASISACLERIRIMKQRHR